MKNKAKAKIKKGINLSSNFEVAINKYYDVEKVYLNNNYNSGIAVVLTIGNGWSMPFCISMLKFKKNINIKK